VPEYGYASSGGISMNSYREYDESFWEHIDRLVSESSVVIDRPKGSAHPKYGFIYPADYGYLEGTSSMDGGGIDVWRGTSDGASADAVICTVDMMKKDSEIKILISCSEDEKRMIYAFHNQNCMRGLFVSR
jgi:inorganic pyrophosphatase